MRIRMAHLQEQGINFAVFDANSTNGTDSGRAAVLADLTRRAREQGLRIEKAALAYSVGGRIRFYGTSDLVDFLANNWRPTWTHTLDM